jgi:hypothetical protein
VYDASFPGRITRLRFRTFQVYPKSAARKHAQRLALSIGHIPRLWQQKAFSGSVDERARWWVMPKTKKQAAPLFGSPTFVATFADGEVTRMTVFGTPDDVDLERAKRLARYAYESRTKKTPPAFLKAHFEQAGAVFRAYSAVELEDEQEDAEAPQ